VQTIQREKKKYRQNNTSSLPIVLSVPLLYPLHCLYLFFTHCIVCTSSLPIVLSVPLLYPLYCLYFFLIHCIVCTCSLPIALSVPVLYPLYCLYLFFTHCIVCTSSLPIVYSVPLHYLRRGTDNRKRRSADNAMGKEEVQTMQWVKKRYRQCNG
jgi:predicted nucleic acid-binding Zn ribbon protein